jgi:hypothetical protein
MACDRIAGPHLLYYAPYGVSITTYLGTTGPEGFRQIREMKVQPVTSDQYGAEAAVDFIFQGQNMYLEFVVQEVNKDIVQQLLHPFQCNYTSSAVSSVTQEDYGVVGRLGCAVAGTLEAIPVGFSAAQSFAGGSATGTAGTYPGTAATNPLSGRQYKGLVVSDITESLDGSGRFVPVRFQVIPDLFSGSTLKMWKWISANTSS